MPTKGTPVSKATNKSVIILHKPQSSETDYAVKVHQSTKLCITGLCEWVIQKKPNLKFAKKPISKLLWSDNHKTSFSLKKKK